MAYQNQIDRFDRDRGDVLSLSREDVARLADYWEYSHPVLHNLFRWFMGEEESAVQMDDPRDNRELRGLIEHQKKNAARRYDYLAAQRERKMGKTKTTDNHGQPRTQVEEQYKPKNSVSVNSLAVYGGEATPPDGSTPTASPSAAIGKEDVIWARQTMARWATAPKFVLAFDPKKEPKREKADYSLIDERAINHLDRIRERFDNIEAIADTWDVVSKCQHNRCIENDYNMLAMVDATMGDGADCDDALRASLRKYRDTLGSTFANAVWSFWIEHLIGSLPATDKEGQPTNPRKLLLGRLKNLARAKAILAQ